MLKGKTLTELAQAVQDAAALKVDVVADTRNIEFSLSDKPTLSIRAAADSHTAELDPHSFRQLVESQGIPMKYAERMRNDNPGLLADNVNSWFAREPSLRMVREKTKVGAPAYATQRSVRAFLSNRYQRIEHERALAVLLPELLSAVDSAGLQIVSTELTDTRMYIKAVFDTVRGEVRKGDVVRYGFKFSNSEIGMGRFILEPFIDRLACLNGMVLSKEIDDTRLAKTHIGKAQDEGVLDYLSDETLEADDKALMLRLRDTLRAFQDPARWAAVLAKLRASTEGGVVADPIEAIEQIAETYALPKPEHNGVLAAFLQGGDFTRWGLANAVTNIANVSESYDRACELEQLGGRILTLAPGEWREISRKAA